MKFFVGLDHPSDAKHFDRCMISINRIRSRKSDFMVGEWIMDSGAFTSIARNGGYTEHVGVYAQQINRWSRCGTLLAAVAQDYMCEPFVLAKTGLTVADHQRLTIERYRDLCSLVEPGRIMPVLQGANPEDYVRHIQQYGDLLTPGMWIGVGSVCKRNGRIDSVERVLWAIHQERPDLRLHGFGIKLTALQSSIVRRCLYSADSMSWSFAARREGRNQHDWREAMAYVTAVEQQTIAHRPGVQIGLPEWG